MPTAHSPRVDAFLSSRDTPPAEPAPVEPPPLPRRPKVVVEPEAPLGPATAFGVLDELLRDRTRFLRRLLETDDLPLVARTLLVAIVVSAASFGAALGFFHGDVQMLFSAVKLPVAVLFTAGLATPALTALRQAVHGHGDLRRDVALVLGALAFGGLVLAALAPVMLLVESFGASYHETTLAAVLCCGLAGVATLALLNAGLQRVGAKSPLVLATLLACFVLVGTQTVWSMRPFLCRPTREATFLRPIEGGFFDSVSRSFDSARGVYHRSSADAVEE